MITHAIFYHIVNAGHSFRIDHTAWMLDNVWSFYDEGMLLIDANCKFNSVEIINLGISKYKTVTK